MAQQRLSLPAALAQQHGFCSAAHLLWMSAGLHSAQVAAGQWLWAGQRCTGLPNQTRPAALWSPPPGELRHCQLCTQQGQHPKQGQCLTRIIGTATAVDSWWLAFGNWPIVAVHAHVRVSWACAFQADLLCVSSTGHGMVRHATMQRLQGQLLHEAEWRCFAAIKLALVASVCVLWATLSVYSVQAT